VTPKTPNLGELPHQIREQLQAAPERWRSFRDRVRDDPSAIFHSPVIRVVSLLVLGLILLFVAAWFVRGLTPPGPAGMTVEATPWSVLYVACVSPKCLAATSAKCARDFDGWPMKCEKCGEMSVYRAQTCAKCGKWFATAPGQPTACPHCARAVTKTEAAPAQTRPAGMSDDDEDPW
jgi:hypothetical protein